MVCDFGGRYNGPGNGSDPTLGCSMWPFFYFEYIIFIWVWVDLINPAVVTSANKLPRKTSHFRNTSPQGQAID